MSSTPYIVLEKLGEGTYATVHKVGRLAFEGVQLLALSQRFSQERAYSDSLY